MCWIGIDAGTKRSGIAISDSLGIAKPRKTVDTDNLIPELEELFNEYEIKGIVLGLPLTTKGKIGQRAKYVLKMKNKLEEHFDVSVELFDERFTTSEAEEIAVRLKKSKDRELIDRISATLILRGFLEEN